MIKSWKPTFHIFWYEVQLSINIIFTILETFFGLQQASLTSGCRRLGRQELRTPDTWGPGTSWLKWLWLFWFWEKNMRKIKLTNIIKHLIQLNSCRIFMSLCVKVAVNLAQKYLQLMSSPPHPPHPRISASQVLWADPPCCTRGAVAGPTIGLTRCP